MWPFKQKQEKKQQRPSVSRPKSAAAAQTGHDDEGFDSAGYIMGVATGIPVSPSRGISAESIIGASIHNSSSTTHTAPASDACHSTTHDTSSSVSSPSCDTSSSSSSFDSGSSSSFDSGSSGSY